VCFYLNRQLPAEMHNQNRTQYKARQSDPIVADRLSKKASSWNTLTRQLLLSRHDGTTKVNVQEKHLAGSTTTTTTSQLRRCDEETCLKVSYKLLLVNPDPSYLWNARRELITFTQLSTELELTKAALQRNPKAYAAWYHRKWCVRYFAMQTHNDKTDCSTSTSTTCSVQLVLEQELHLCSELLNADERNFHCWNYRRFVVGAMASQIHLLSSSSSSLVRTPVEEDKYNAAESSQPPPPLLHTTIDYCSALDGSWDTFVNALLITSTNSIDQYHYSPCFPYYNLCRIGPQLTRNNSVPPAVGCSDNKNTTTSLNNLPSCITHEKQRNQLLELLRGEWGFTTQKIEQNFSNYSAYHYRSKLLPLWISVLISSSSSSENNNNNSVSTIQQFLLSEFQVVRNAIYTEPDDQSSWWYHRYLLDYCKNIATTASDNDRHNFIYVNVLLLEREAVQELLRAEDGQCKWGWITLHAILLRLMEIRLVESKTNTTTVCPENYDSSFSNLQLLREEAEECLLKLIELDPDRLLRYQDMLQDLHQTKELDV